MARSDWTGRRLMLVSACLALCACTGSGDGTQSQNATPGTAAATADKDDETDLGQTGGTVGGIPKRCPEMPDPTKTNAGLGVPLTDDHAEEWAAYADTLCFVEAVTIEGEPASHLARKGDDDVKLWILPERHVHLIDSATFANGSGRIVARIWNADPNARDFKEWPKLKHNDRSAYLWIGPEGTPARTVAKVFKIKKPASANPQIEILAEGQFVAVKYVPAPKWKYARARWGHPPGERHTGVTDTVMLNAIKSGHNTGWFDCASGCCSALGLW